MQKTVSVDREKYIGGSDIPIIMGISPFKKRYDLLLEKAGLKENTFDGNEYTEYGNIMEEKIRNYINETYKTNYEEGIHIKDDIRCHTDGENEDSILEIKTTSQIHETVDEYRVYLVQLLFYMMNTTKSLGKLAVYNRPNDFNEEFDKNRLTVYDITINDYVELCKKINLAVEQFRIDLEKIKSNPFLAEEDLIPIEVAKISNMIVALENRLAEYKEMEKEQAELKKQLKELMEDKGLTKWITSNGTKITLVPDGEDKEVQKFNEKKFKEEHQEEYEKYLENKIQKGKSGYILITLPKGEENE